MIKRYMFFLLVASSFVHAVSLVYNLRVRRIFTIPIVISNMKARTLATSVPIVFYRTSDILEDSSTQKIFEKRRTAGSLINVRYVPSTNWWAELSTAILADHAKFCGGQSFQASRYGFDDIVATGGYRHFVGDKIQLVGYGLVGLPTKRAVSRLDRFGPLVGTRLYNVGAGVEASYSLVNELKRSCALIVQGRIIHGLNREWFPILPRDAQLVPGNVSDLLCTVQARHKKTVLELGYDATIFSQQAIKLPMQTEKSDTFVRHSGYLIAYYGKFRGFFNKPTIIGLGANVSFSKRFNAKTVSGWLFCTQVF